MEPWKQPSIYKHQEEAMRACMGAGLHECMGGQADLGKGVVAEGEVDAVGHLQTVQLALPDVGQAAPDQRHLPAQDAQRVQGNECTVPAADSILSGLSFTLQLARYHREPVLATEYALLHAGQPAADNAHLHAQDMRHFDSASLQR